MQASPKGGAFQGEVRPYEELNYDLAIDIGNTTVALGGIRDGRVCFVAHMDTVRTRTAAEYRAEMEKVFAHRRHPEKPIRFEGAVLTSVVPQITGALAECARYYTGKSRSSFRPTSAPD